MKTYKWSNYDELYREHFNRPGRLLEIGINEGGSLLHWQAEGHEVFGIDVKTGPYIQGARQFIGNVCNPFFMWQVVRQLPTLDYVVDDGGHRPYQQWLAFKWLWPKIKVGGVYCIEDLHMGQRIHWRLWEALGLPGIGSIRRSLWRKMNGPWDGSPSDKPLTRHHQLHAYPHIIFIRKCEQQIVVQTKDIHYEPAT